MTSFCAYDSNHAKPSIRPARGGMFAGLITAPILTPTYHVFGGFKIADRTERSTSRRCLVPRCRDFHSPCFMRVSLMPSGTSVHTTMGIVYSALSMTWLVMGLRGTARRICQV
jgi:hypothetical protein